MNTISCNFSVDKIIIREHFFTSLCALFIFVSPEGSAVLHSGADWMVDHWFGHRHGCLDRPNGHLSHQAPAVTVAICNGWMYFLQWSIIVRCLILFSLICFCISNFRNSILWLTATRLWLVAWLAKILHEK